MFNTNKTLEQKVKSSMTTLHFIERSVIIRASEPRAYSQTDAFTLSGFKSAFKAALNDRNSTGHRVSYIIMTGLMHSQRRRNDTRSSLNPPELPSVLCVCVCVCVCLRSLELRDAHQTHSLHSLTKLLKSLLVV